MAFPYSDDANLSAAGSTYGGYCDFQLLNNGMNYRETAAENEVTVDSPDSTGCSCHGYSPIIDAHYALHRSPEWESSFEPSANSIDRWIEYNERIRTQRFQGPSADVGPSNFSLRFKSEKETPTATISGSMPQETPEEQTLALEKRPAALQCRWEGCTYAKRFSRTADLLRHVSAIHLSRGQYHCPIDASCKPFNRKDNLTAHIQRRHNIAI